MLSILSLIFSDPKLQSLCKEQRCSCPHKFRSVIAYALRFPYVFVFLPMTSHRKKHTSAVRSVIAALVQLFFYRSTLIGANPDRHWRIFVRDPHQRIIPVDDQYPIDRNFQGGLHVLCFSFVSNYQRKSFLAD